VKILPPDATDAQVLSLCREWVELVAADRLDDALGMLSVPSDYDPSQHWTSESLRSYIENYGSWEPLLDGSKWQITSFVSVRTPVDRPAFRPGADVYRDERDPRAGRVEIDLPLNGEWSDLTAQFDFRPVSDGIAISLYDLHVL